MTAPITSAAAGPVVVVGAGMAAVRLAEGLTARGVGVTLLGDEDAAPYNRILLSAVLEGSCDPSLLALHPRGWYADAGVTLRTGARVVDVDRDAREVVLADDERVAYEHLVLGTGSLPTLPPIRGVVRPDGGLHPRVHPFRSLADCRRLQEALAQPGTRRAVVVGGGLLGLQVARALAVRGLAVEVVEGGEHLLRSQVGAPAGRILARDLRRLGTEVYTGARATRLLAGPDGDGSVTLVLDNGATLDTDLVVLTAGGRPSTALARRAGLAVRRGVVVDGHLTTSDPRVHALGDCAEHDGVVTGFVPPAWDQADALAAHLSGETGPHASYAGHRSVARLRATDLDVAVLGDPRTAVGDVVEVTNPVVGSHRRLVVRDGRIVAATLVGDLSRVGLITGHYDRGTVLGPAEPAALLAGDRPPAPRTLADDAEVCTCAGATAGAVRACTSLEDVRATTRATTGCGGCADDVRALLASRPLTPQGGSR
jgi:assimilatory nitrate reductase electron transfer subunit